MKKVLFPLAITLLSTLIIISCGKKPKNITCDVVPCEFGQNMQTCLCNPNPNDTTNVPDPNDTTDTPTNPIIVSKFGNGSNGTIDTTQSYMDFKGYNKNSLYSPNNTYGTLHEVISGLGNLVEAETNAYDVLKNGVYINVTKRVPNWSFLRIDGGNIFWVSCDDILPNPYTDSFFSLSYSTSLPDQKIVNSYNESLKAFVVYGNQPDIYPFFYRILMKNNHPNPLEIVDLPYTHNEYRVKPIVKNGQRQFYIVFKFKYENDFFEIRTMLKREYQ